MDSVKYSSRVKSFENHLNNEIAVNFASHGFYLEEDTIYVRCFACSKRMPTADVTSHQQVIHENCDFVRLSLEERQIEHPGEPYKPEFSKYEDRLSTYNDWQIPKNYTDIAAAGFIYTGFGDKVECFYCGIILKHWNHDDNPFVEHAKVPNHPCAWMVAVRGQKFLDECRSLPADVLEDSEEVNEDAQENLENINHPCKICFVKPSNICLAPCGHTVCSKCSLQLSVCYLCKQNIASRFELTPD